MPKPYFRNIGNFEYVNRNAGSKTAEDYIAVKNLFKRGKLREDIISELAYFEKYQITGDDRPDNVAYQIYNDARLDWVIFICNNITDVYTEWPMPQNVFDTYLLDKYGSYEKLNEVHHYETNEVKDSQGSIIVKKGVRVGVGQSVSFFDYYRDQQVTISDITTPVTNYQYEEKLNDDRRNIFILKPTYLNIVYDDLEEMMQYKEGSTQYVSETLRRADNPRLYD